VYRSKHCSVQTACHGDRPTKRCYTCAEYDVAGQGIYCDACFEVRHPWYRVEHRWVAFTPHEERVEEEVVVSPRSDISTVIQNARQARDALVSVKQMVRSDKMTGENA